MSPQPGALNQATPQSNRQRATGNRQRESEMKYFLDNPRARVLIGHQNFDPRILLNVTRLYHRAASIKDRETRSG
jgi:hypothetical protein